MTPENRLGIVGGGQLGRMMTPCAKRLGFEVTVIDPTPNCPAKQMGADQIVASLTDKEATRQLAKKSDFLTFEIEHVNTGILRELRADGTKINPSPDILGIIKDKLQQKRFLQSSGIPAAPFLPVDSAKDIREIIEIFGFPIVLKSRFGGYDGRGNVVITNTQDIKTAVGKLGNQPLYAEKFVPFAKELAVMVARDTRGNIATYPVVETIHKNNICHLVLAPAPVDNNIHQEANRLARETMRHLEGAGVFGIEMFLTEDGKVLVNEIAPRVHNSGHYTIEACTTSQFEQHVRAVTGLPLGETRMNVKAAVMINVLGDRQGQASLSGLEKALQVSGIGLHVYGKQETRPERKMGHITVVADSIEQTRRNAEFARSLISI